MPSTSNILRSHEGVPMNVRPRFGVRLQWAGNVVPYLRPTVEITTGTQPQRVA
ncbi:MAG: hypothetical protein J7513_09140 [Solirubrobacteraceae bacterium]|nr:hypothetical protein [Solirubrobacteraceae bacterium]